MKSKTGLTAWFALLAAILVSVANVAHTQALEKVKVVIPQNSVFVLNWVGAKDAGVFSKHGIDANIDVRPFAGYLAGLPAKEADASTYSGLDGVAKMSHGMDLAVIGGGLTVFQEIFVLKDSPIKSVADLKGKRFGVWATGAGAYKAVRAILIEGYGIDVVKDTKLVQLAPPALFKLLERGEVDAMLNISSFTIQAASQPDKFRSIFVPNDYWKKKTGYPIVWSAPLIAWRDWVTQNPKRAKNFVAAVHESFNWLAKPENMDAAVKEHGQLAGVSSPDQIATYKKWLAENKIFLSEWNQKVVDAQWQFLELAQRHGILDAVPPKDKHALVLN